MSMPDIAFALRPRTPIHLAVLVASFAFAAGATIAQAQAPAGIGGVRADFLGSFGRLEAKLVQLAEAVPADKYDYTPGMGVRTFCEVLVHIGADNYGVATLFGGPAAPKPQLADPRTPTCYADKAMVIADMKVSFAAARAVITNANTMDMDANVTAFGATMARRTWLLEMAEHAGEHLGQLIAYARMNGIRPPWSK